LQALKRALLAYREGRFGDAAAYKAAIFRARPYPEVAEKLSALEEPLPTISLDALRMLDEGTLGCEYAMHMDGLELEPLDLSDTVREELAPFVLGLRYTLLHDLFHVLLDFDTSWPGELGVWEFVGAQRYSPAYTRAARTARIVYPLLAPTQLGALRGCSQRAKHLAARAPCLIAHDFRPEWARPLEDVRADLHLDAKRGQSPFMRN
jgi:ubiquinone biosynthesis protein Coq4